MNSEALPAPGTADAPEQGTGTYAVTQRDVAPTTPTASLKGMIVFVALVMVLAWFVALPLWLGDGIASPLFRVLATVMMFTPTISALVVVRFVEHRPIRDALGLRPSGPARRTVIWLAIAFAAVFALCFLSLVSSALVGAYHFDVVGMSGFEQTLSAQLAAFGKSIDELGLSLRVLWLLQFVNIISGSMINTVFAAGEEIGWRGYLFPALSRRLGSVGAVLVVGVIWGLWHAPVILLGYNYPTDPRLGVLAMCVLCIGLGAVLAWASQRGGSVWPAALGHGTMNAAAGGFITMFGDARTEVDTLTGTILGWGGWLVLLPVAALVCWSMVHAGQNRLAVAEVG